MKTLSQLTAILEYLTEWQKECSQQTANAFDAYKRSPTRDNRQQYEKLSLCLDLLDERINQLREA